MFSFEICLILEKLKNNKEIKKQIRKTGKENRPCASSRPAQLVPPCAEAQLFFAMSGKYDSAAVMTREKEKRKNQHKKSTNQAWPKYCFMDGHLRPHHFLF
jgi:hypothetical protein